MAGGFPFWTGSEHIAQSTMATAKITVPARRRKTFERSSNRRPSERKVGHRYGGISRTKGTESLFRTEDFSSRAVTKAAAKARRHRPIIAAARTLRKGPSNWRSGRNAAVIRI